MIKIDKDIPIAPRPRGAIRKYPWDDMEIGDSFFLPAEKRHTLSSAAVRTLTENGVKGVRCWRVA